MLVAALPRTFVVLGSNQGLPGWCVLVLREHREHLAELPREEQAAIFGEVARVAGAIRAVFSNSGVHAGPPRINYECLGNQVNHIHWHVIPRHADDPDPRNAVWGIPPEKMQGSMSDGEKLALIAKLRGAISGRE
jgi:diadenosine tetraphosphate (Ap4A) HIT family hydrolase